MLRRITFALPDEIVDRLDRLAREHMRDRKQQAAALVVDGVERAERQAARRRRGEAAQ